MAPSSGKKISPSYLHLFSTLPQAARSSKKLSSFLPNSIDEGGNQNLDSKTLTMSQGETSHHPCWSSANDIKKSSAALPMSINLSLHKEQYPESSSEYEILPPIISDSNTNVTNGNQRAEAVSNSLVSLNTTLPFDSMFFKSENTINDYKRRDPRTIIYSKIKPTMPIITADEINMLQRYSGI